ncbi:hypothetical protein OG786_24195 [Streptomyces sp. NBC_00101]|uniref:DUF7847 domain-containing protein n=1 Tax=Streptomyces sp. NBC_00101 TaxID=2975651 RepID=UPI00324DC9F3
MFNGAFTTMGRYWKQLFGFTAAVYGTAAVVVVAALLVALSAVHEQLERIKASSLDTDTVDGDDITPVIVALGAVTLVGLVVAVVAMALVQAAVPAVLREAVLGRPVTFRSVGRTAGSRLRAMVGTVLLTSLIGVVPVVLMAVGEATALLLVLSDGHRGGAAVAMALSILLLLASAPLALWLWVKFSLAPTAVVLEDQGPVDALRRSSHLVRGDWWRVFGIGMLGYLVAGVASYFVQLPFSLLGVFSSALTTGDLGSNPTLTSVLVTLGSVAGIVIAGQLIGQTFVGTFPPLLLGLVYVDRRMRTENLAQGLTEAAGLTMPSYGYGPFHGYGPAPYGPPAPPYHGAPGHAPTPPAGPAPQPPGKDSPRDGGDTAP